MSEGEPLSLYLIAGESSGDLIGGLLLDALRESHGGTISVAGIGGPEMTARGLSSLFPMAELSLIDLKDIALSLPRLLRRLSETERDIRIRRPDVLVGIDCPKFSLRVARRVADLAMPRIHYVAPTVWAYAPGRAARMAAFIDHLLLLYPFEAPYFERVGLATTYVGPPVLETGAGGGKGREFRERHGLAPDARVLCLLPGSRRSEIRMSLPLYRAVAKRVTSAVPECRLVMPVAESVADDVATALGEWPSPPVAVEMDERHDAMAASDLALAAAGTVTLELAASRTPAIVTGRVAGSTAAWLRLTRHTIRFAALPNWIADRTVMPEFLQEACRADPIAEAIVRLIRDPVALGMRKQDLEEVMGRLDAGEDRPSRRAAKAILQCVGSRPR